MPAIADIFAEAVRYHQSGNLAEAEHRYRQILAVEPRHADSLHLLAHYNLGVMLQDLKRNDEAIAAYSAALALRTDYAEAHNNLGNVLQELGRADDAIGAYRRAIVVRPVHAQTWNNLGVSLRAMGRQEEAAATYRRALHLAPLYAEAHNNLGNALQDLGRYAEAILTYRGALVLEPVNAGALNNLGTTVREGGRLEDALSLYDKAGKLGVPGYESPLANQALLLMEMGRTGDSLIAVKQALAINPRSARSWFTLSELKIFSIDDPDIGSMKSVLATAESQGMLPADQILLQFALGKAWMDAGDGDRAFAHFDAGNRLKRSIVAYDAEANDRRIDDIIGAFTPELMTRFAGIGESSDVPLFIIGMPRSGTTLIEQVLASHRAVHGAGELTLLSDLVDGIAGPDRYPQSLPQMPPEAIRRLGRDYAAQIEVLAPERRRVIDKMPLNFLYAGLIHLMLPNARIIHCRRDPIDTCLSCYTKKFSGELNFSYDLRELGQFYRSYDILMSHWRALLPPERFIEVRYEDLVDGFEQEARRLVAFCDLDWDEACMAFHQTRRPIRTASVNAVRQPLYRASVGRWKPYEQYLGPLLAALA